MLLTQKDVKRMSRSHKKTPVYKDGSNQSKRRKYSKKQAHKKVRKWQGSFKKSNHYRKISEQWDICDYRFYEAEPDSAIGEDYDHWKKYYFRK